jgi:hypothetical protein
MRMTSTELDHSRMSAARDRGRTASSVVLTLIALLSGLISLSVNAPMTDPFEHDARVLISTFGVGMAVLAAAVTLVPFRRGERWAWSVLWVWPAFFVVHVVTLGTVLPDGIFALLTVGALLVSRPGATSSS